MQHEPNVFRAAVALALASLLGCVAPTGEPGTGEGLGEAPLYDSTHSGKTDSIQDKVVDLEVIRERSLEGTVDRGSVTVTDTTAHRMSVRGDLVVLRSEPDERIAVSIANPARADTAIMRYLLFARPADGSRDWRQVTVEATESPLVEDPEWVRVSYFGRMFLDPTNESMVFRTEEQQHIVRVSGYGAEPMEWGLFVLPVDTWGSLEGEHAYRLEARCDSEACNGGSETAEPEPDVDVYAGARDVDLARVPIPDDAPAPPASYEPSVVGSFSVSWMEFSQQWADGHDLTHDYQKGTVAGRHCIQASEIRFQAIMADPPPALQRLYDESRWSGSFYNWNQDFSESSRDADGAWLWAWRTHLIKWISQTGKDGTCHLPTYDLVERMATDCLAKAEADGGDIAECAER